ncbi:hypothetical protein [Sphingomonas bacterium]|uniref:hypothetical protein n=1 Tax=Sphingomonas bacterium TaxID=1895847 RepID=UPI0015754750|nr:hypothetical protein [Sphingomonas bacterium]
MILLALLAEAMAVPAQAAGPIDTLHHKVVEAIRNCPKAEDGTIAVCAKDRGYAQRFRLQKLDQRFAGGNPPVTVGPLSGVGAVGIGSCSATGAGGSTGCVLREDNAWGEWKKQQKAEGREFPW